MRFSPARLIHLQLRDGHSDKTTAGFCGGASASPASLGRHKYAKVPEMAELAELSFSNFPSLIALKWCGTNLPHIIWEVRHDATETLSISDST
jgi:hypothetical protein